MKFDLEERLVNFAVLILEITEILPDTKGGNHLSGQHQLCIMVKHSLQNQEKILFTK